MNVNDFERLQANPEIKDKVASQTYYAMGKARDPHFTAKWAEVPQEEKEKASKIGFQSILAIVDDYTTPGCKCTYCKAKGRGEGIPIMCEQRWDQLSSEEQNQIAESCAD